MESNQPPLSTDQPFDPNELAHSVIALPLLEQLAMEETSRKWLSSLREWASHNEIRNRRWPSWFRQFTADRPVNEAIEDLLALLQLAGLAPSPTEQAQWRIWVAQWLAKPTASGQEPRRFPVIIDLNLKFSGGRPAAREQVFKLADSIVQEVSGANATWHGEGEELKNKYVQQYVFARLTGKEIRALVRRDADYSATPKNTPSVRAIYRIWPDFAVQPTVNKSIATVKADAAQVSYSALGENIVWAVIDSGIEEHRHFEQHHNLQVALPLEHVDFTNSAGGPLTDEFGHGTHVAGIIAGELRDPQPPIAAFTLRRDERNNTHYEPVPIKHISGIAPKCKLLSLKVLNEQGKGEASSLIAAIGLIQELNGHGRHLLVQGVNMSVGYEFEPRWFACGQSPLCVEVNRLVRSGVVVVVAAGNTGHGVMRTYENTIVAAGMAQTINDPGNADLAITVGSTHRDMPHIYGVSYFSSKGPTGDGRLKPDLVAPGEKIISCAAGRKRTALAASPGGGVCDYLEQSGTSQATPHVSGAIAAFLSIRHEFVGYPEKVKSLFLASATDLKRERYFQGAGLIDLMRAIQSV